MTWPEVILAILRLAAEIWRAAREHKQETRNERDQRIKAATAAIYARDRGAFTRALSGGRVR